MKRFISPTNISRRRFFGQLGQIVAGSSLIPAAIAKSSDSAKSTPRYVREARYYRQLDNEKVQCLLCPKKCVTGNGKRGVCRVRENQAGSYKTLVYGRLTSMNLDPIEKKPLFHFLPSTTALSVATAGCNVRCKFCQNWNISQANPEEVRFRYVSPEELVQTARRYGARSIAYTYNEPIVFIEYMLDSATLAKAQGVHSVMISNGYLNRKPLDDLCKQLSAIKVDFKAFSDRFYHQTVSGSLQPVLDTMVRIKEQGVWLEMVYLVITTLNDEPQELREMCQWIINNLGTDVPLHFTRYHPQYLLKNLPPTPIPTLQTAYQIARDAGIQYVYLGNVPTNPAENTYCASCGKMVVERTGFAIRSVSLQDGKCAFCGNPIPGIWS